MEKCKSFPQYSSYCSHKQARFGGFEDRTKSYSFNGPTDKAEGFAATSNPELQRRKRVASYNMYSMEGKVRTSLRNSVKWFKNKFADHSHDM